MQAISVVRVALLAVALAFCADHALAQRSSTIEQNLSHDWDSARGDDIVLTKTPTPQQCREACVANKQCRYWNWVQPDAGGTDPKVHSNCVLLKAIKTANRGRDLGYRYYGGAIVSDGPSTVGTSQPTPGAAPGPAPTATAQQPFPLPPLRMELVFRVPAPGNPNIDRYASFQFVSHKGERTLLRRIAWEGPLNSPDNSGEQYVDYIFDESPGTASSSCTVSASDAALRQIYVGAKLNYTRTCTTTHNNGGGSRSVANVERIVLRAERVTVPLGSFDALVVKKTTRGIYRSISPTGEETMMETTESENTKWWVPALGFFVKDEWRNRVVSRVFSQKMIDDYRRENEPLPPRSVDWYSSPAMIAIRQR